MANVGFATLQVIPSLKGLDRSMSSGLTGPLSRAGSDAGHSASRGFLKSLSGGIMGAAGSIGRNASKALAGGLLIGGGLAAVFGKQAIDSASDLNETLSKTRVVLGPAAEGVIKFSETTAKSLGQSQQSALDAASTFGVFGKSAGLQGAKLGKFSTDFTKLSSDMASFSNTSPEEAIEAIGAALRGESEPIRKYGVLLDDATLRTAALKLGIIDNVKKALTPQQKVLAAQAEIFRQTTDAQGDFARTSDGVANKQRILSAQVDNLKAKLGKGLLPIFSGFLSVANATILPAVDKIQLGFKALGGAFREGDVTSGGFIGAFEHVGVALRSAKLGISALFGAFQEGDVTSTGFVGGMEKVGVALKNIVAEVGPRLQSFIAALLPQIQKVGAALFSFFSERVVPLAQSIATNLIPVLVKIGQKLAEFFAKVIAPMAVEIGKFATTVATKMVPVLKRVGDALATFIGFLTAHSGAVKTFAKVVLGLLVARFAALKIKAAIDGIRAFVSNVAAGVKSTLDFARGVGRVASSMASFAKSVTLGTINLARQTAVFITQKVAMIASAVATKTLAAAQWLLNVAMTANPIGLIVAGIAALAAGIFIAYKKFKPFRVIVDAVGRALAGAFNWVKKNWPLILGILTGPFGIAIVIIKKFGPQILSGLKTAFSAVIGFFTQLPGRIVGALGAVGSILLNIGKAILGGLLTGAKFALGVYLAFYVKLPIKILGLLAGAASWLLNIGKKIIGGLLKGAAAGAVAVFKFFGELELKVLRVFVAAATWLFDVGKRILTGLLGGIRNGALAVFEFFTLLPLVVVGKIGNVARLLFDKGLNILLGLGNGIVDGAGKVLGWVADLPGRILDALGDVGSLLFDAGKKVVTGFIDGLKSAAGGIKDAVGGLAGGVVDFFPFSPAKTGPLRTHPPEQWGRNIGGQLASGLAKSLPGLDKQLGTIAGKFGGLSAPMLTVGAKAPRLTMDRNAIASTVSATTLANSRPMAPIQINFNGPFYGNRREVERLMDDAAEKAMRRHHVPTVRGA